MDPNAAFESCLAALTDGDWQEARDYYDNIVSWLNSGGFPPSDPEWSQKVFRLAPLDWSYLSR